MKKPLSIVWIASGREGPYGVGRATESLMAEMRRRGHEVAAVCLSGGELADRLRRQGFAVEHGDWEADLGFGGAAVAERVASIWRHAGQSRRLTRLIEGLARPRQPAVLHVQWPSLMPVTARAARRLGAACFWEMPNAIGTGRWLGLNRLGYQWACWRDGVHPLANSAFTAGTLGAWPVRAQVFHLGADAAVFDPETTRPMDRSDLAVPAGSAMLLVAGRLTALKGQRRLAKAVLERAAAGDDWHLVLVGGPVDGEEAEAIRSLAQAHPEGDRVHLTGTTDKVERYFAAADVVANVRVDPEPFGLTVVEAMLMGRPVLAHALGGPAETVLDGRTGWHLPAMSHGAVVSGLQRVYADRGRWAAMGAAARARALEHFTYRAVGDRYEAALSAVLG